MPPKAKTRRILATIMPARAMTGAMPARSATFLTWTAMRKKLGTDSENGDGFAGMVTRRVKESEDGSETA